MATSSLSVDEQVALKKADRPRVQSAANAVEILLAIAGSSQGLTTREVAEAAHLSRQVTYHMLHTLSGSGLVSRAHGNRYILGLRAGVIADGFSRQISPAEHLGPIVRELAATTGETAYAGGWWDDEVTILTIARGHNPAVSSEASAGFTGMAHARASGKLLLAFAPGHVVERYLALHPLEPKTSRTITTRDALDRELETIRLQGYALDDEEFAEGLCCAAFPLDGGRLPFVIALSAPKTRFETFRDSYLESLRRASALGQ